MESLLNNLWATIIAGFVLTVVEIVLIRVIQ